LIYGVRPNNGKNNNLSKLVVGISILQHFGDEVGRVMGVGVDYKLKKT
jgi:hypothetical protein